MKTQLITIGLAITVLIAMNACSIRPKAAAMHDLGGFYGLNGIPETTSQLTQNPSPITVEAPKWLEDKGIHYRLMYSIPTQVRSYTLDRWIASPPELFSQLLNSSGKAWPKPLTIQLHVFEQQFIAPEQAKVVMQFTAATLPDNNTSHSVKREFNLQLPCPTADAKGAVSTFTKLTRQAVDQIQAWVNVTQ